MTAYDVLSLGKTLPSHQMLSTDEARKRAPGLSAQGLVGAALYYDAQVEFAERLVVENALAAIDAGARLITYAQVDKFVVENNMLTGVEFVDEFSGKRERTTAPLIINAAGPWVDRVLQNGDPTARLIGGTKGSHLIVPPFSGAAEVALYVEAKIDRRPFFVIPWNNNYLIGTTDLRYEGNLDDVRISEDEIEYLLDSTNAVFPGAELTRSDILYSYAGIRPLPFTSGTAEQSITRRHFIRPHPKHENLLSLVSGKLTTYRSLAEETVDLVFSKLGRRAPDCDTGKVSLSEPTETSASPSAMRLNRIYGSRAAKIKELTDHTPELDAVFDKETGAIAAEVVYTFEHEFARTLTDCLMRRTMVGLNSSVGVGAAEAAAKVAQEHLGWSAERAGNEVRAYRNYIKRLKV